MWLSKLIGDYSWILEISKISAMTAPKLDELRDFISFKYSDQQENIDLDELKLATNVAFYIAREPLD